LNGPSASTYSAQQQFSAQSNQPLVIIDKDGNQIEVTVVTNERSTGGNISAKNDESSWIFNVCTFENALTAKECKMCGTKCSVTKKDGLTSSVKPTLLEIGYTEEQIDEALEAIDEADYDNQERDCHFLD
jgi:hypothetical protein